MVRPYIRNLTAVQIEKLYQMAHILIVEDKASMALMLKETLETEGHHATLAADGKEGKKRLKESRFDMVITDLKLPKCSGLEVLKASKEEFPLVPVIIMTAFGTVESAVNAMKEGAYDFLTKPIDTDYLALLVNRALENQRLLTENMLLKDALGERLAAPIIIGQSPIIKETLEKIRKVAPTKTTVTLYGESGTGKELFARAIHYLSPRKSSHFVPVNCAAIPKELLESEFFGHDKGAFTGADERKIGKFELADGGAIFLDEIGEMDMSLQSKLLRSLQGGEIQRVGSSKLIHVDVRVIAATNKDLIKAIENQTFREDLYYRLNVFPVNIPPLRERKEDIPALVNYMIEKFSAEMKIPPKKIAKTAIQTLQTYPWKGNVRELENAIERAMILCDGNIITEEFLGVESTDKLETALANTIYSDEGSLEDATKKAIQLVETHRIRKALQDTAGNKSKAAEILNVSYKTLLTKIKDYGIKYTVEE